MLWSNGAAKHFGSATPRHTHLSNIIMDNSQQFGVVFVQMQVTDNKMWNIQHAERLVRTAYAKFRPRLVVLPEYFNTKWGAESFEQFAELYPEGETFVVLRRLAEELGVYVVGGSVPERDPKNNLYNTTVVFAPSGALLAKYRKIHLFDVELEKSQLRIIETETYKLQETERIKAGNEMAVFEVDGVRIGLGIGYDLSFAELAHLYRQQGAEMVIYPSVYPAAFGCGTWVVLNRARAIDNQMYVLGVAQARNDPSTAGDYVQYGHSMLVDWSGRVVARAGDDEEFVHATLSFGELRQFRRRYDRTAYKRTDVYETVYKQY